MRRVAILLVLAGCTTQPERDSCVIHAPVPPADGPTRYATMLLRQDGAPCGITLAAAETPKLLLAPAHGQVTVTPDAAGWRVLYTRGEPKPPAPPTAAQAKVTQATAAPAAAARVTSVPSPNLAPPTSSPVQAEPAATAPAPPPAAMAENAAAATANVTTYLGGDWFEVAEGTGKLAVDVTVVP